MKAYQDITMVGSLLRTSGMLILWAAAAGSPALPRAEAGTNVVIWDTVTPLGNTLEAADQAGWRRVPTDLLSLEKEPPKASSDPGYYGRDYAFTGDAVVENHHLAAIFWAAKGRVALFLKTDAAAPVGTGLGRKILELVPLPAKDRPTGITRCEIVRNAGDEAALKVFYPAQGSTEMSATFVFDRSEIAEIRPAAGMQGLSVLSPIEYAVLPGFITDDLIFGPAEHAVADTLFLPAENLLVGLLHGGDDEFVMTWPKGKQQVRLGLGQERQGKRPIESVDFDNDGKSIYLAALGARGIWHREELKPAYLEKDTALRWQRPFPAKWKTQLYEEGVKTTFSFRDSKGQIWRGVPGSYDYPAWFEGTDAFYHFSKKIPPKGESLIYFLEGQDTPGSVSTPVDILKATLGRQVCEPILDVGGRKLRTHHRRGGDGVRRACTCGVTEAIQSFFEAGEEADRKKEIEAALDDMIYFVGQHVARIDEYRRFADELIGFLQAQGSSSPDLKAYAEHLEPIARQIPNEYTVQKENMGSPEYAAELTRRTLALADKKDPGNLKAYMELLKAWRAMGGAQDYVLARCHTITRTLWQEAGYGCVNRPEAAALAGEIRMRCRQILRNPDGYEIWADY